MDWYATKKLECYLNMLCSLFVFWESLPKGKVVSICEGVHINSITFNIPKIMPGSTYRLQSGYKSDKIPIVRITSNSSVIRIIPAGIETFFQKNEILILFNSVVFWILILVISYRYKFFLNYFAKIRSYSNKI